MGSVHGWRLFGAGVVALTVIWGVECVRKGDLMWPWPAVPLAIWAMVLLLHRRSGTRIGS
jgi:hypothetical protein